MPAANPNAKPKTQEELAAEKAAELDRQQRMVSEVKVAGLADAPTPVPYGMNPAAQSSGFAAATPLQAPLTAPPPTALGASTPPPVPPQATLPTDQTGYNGVDQFNAAKNPQAKPPEPTPTRPPGVDPGQNPARVTAGFEDVKVNQGDGRADIYRSEQGAQRRGGSEGYQGSIFEGAAIDQARQLPAPLDPKQPGLRVPQDSNVSRVVTDANGRVVGYAKNYATPQDAQNASRIANPNGIQTPNMSPIEQRDYDRAVVEARQSSQERRDQPNMNPVFVSDGGGNGGTAFVNPNITRQNSRDREAAEARAIGVDRSLDISAFNQGRNPSMNAVSNANVALAPGGFSSVGVNPELRRERVERGVNAEVPSFLPPDMQDRFRARKDALVPQLGIREQEQAQLEGLPGLNDRTDTRLSDKQLSEAIELAKKLKNPAAMNTSGYPPYPNPPKTA